MASNPIKSVVGQTYMKTLYRKNYIHTTLQVTKMMPNEPGGLGHFAASKQCQGDNILHLGFQYWMSRSGWPSA